MNANVTQHNALPYMLIVIMALLLYIAYDEVSDARAEAKQAKADARLVHETSQEMFLYHETRFDEISKIKNTEWKEGEHETIF